MSTLALIAVIPPLKGLIFGFIILVLVIAFIAGLIWCIDQWIHPIPPPAKLIIALVMVALILLWAVETFIQ